MVSQTQHHRFQSVSLIGYDRARTFSESLYTQPAYHYVLLNEYITLENHTDNVFVEFGIYH